MTASAAEVKLAFRRKALALHPDVNSAPDASERFQKVSQAYGEVFRSPLFRVYVCPHGIHDILRLRSTTGRSTRHTASLWSLHFWGVL